MGKYLFFDMDGTLLVYTEEGPKITEKTKKVLREVQKMGHHLYIASGRPWAFLDDEVKNFGFNGFILANGACVIENGKLMANHPIGKERIQPLVEEFEKRKMEYVLEAYPYTYLSQDFKNLEAFYNRCAVDFDHIIRQKGWEHFDQIHKLETWHDSDENNAFVSSLQAQNFGIMGGDLTYEIYDRHISKATGVLDVLKAHHVPVEDAYAFGDNMNDLEMLEVVGHAYAMGNAVDGLKEVADEVILTNTEDGVACKLEELFFK